MPWLFSFKGFLKGISLSKIKITILPSGNANPCYIIIAFKILKDTLLQIVIF